MTRMQRAAALLLSAVLICSCAFAADADIILPEPPAAPAHMILGDSSTAQSREVTLYFAGDSSSIITSSTRSIPVKMNESLVESTLAYLLSSRLSENGRGSAAGDAELIGVESACGIVTVNLSIGSSAQLSDQAELQRYASIANTLLSLEGVEAVNILTGDLSDAVCSLPLGAITRLNESISAQYAQLQSEREDFLNLGNTKLRRDVVLYFPSTNGYLLPELRSLEFSSGNYIDAILDALKAGPMESPQCFSPIPGYDDVFYAAPTVQVNEAGERILELNFSANLPNYLAFSGMHLWQFYGSIVLSACSFMPELDAVRMCIEGAPISDYAIGDRILPFADNLMRRSHFSSMIGSKAILYCADSEGRLTRIERALSQAAASTPKGLLTSLIQFPVPEGCSSVFPYEVYADDILGVEVDAGVANVNLSGSFYARCQGLNSSQERNLIYAMVNTLAELPEIGAVRFLVEGMTVDSLCGDIYLKTALMPDPGVAG